MDIDYVVYVLRKMMFLLIFLPFLLFFLVTITLLAISWIRILKNKSAVLRAKQQAYAETHDEQGNALPPTARGVCQSCGRFEERIYYLPDGSRVCEACYQPIKEEEKVSKNAGIVSDASDLARQSPAKRKIQH